MEGENPSPSPSAHDSKQELDHLFLGLLFPILGFHVCAYPKVIN